MGICVRNTTGGHSGWINNIIEPFCSAFTCTFWTFCLIPVVFSDVSNVFSRKQPTGCRSYIENIWTEEQRALGIISQFKLVWWLRDNTHCPRRMQITSNKNFSTQLLRKTIIIERCVCVRARAGCIYYVGICIPTSSRSSSTWKFSLSDGNPVRICEHWQSFRPDMRLGDRGTDSQTQTRFNTNAARSCTGRFPGVGSPRRFRRGPSRLVITRRRPSDRWESATRAHTHTHTTRSRTAAYGWVCCKAQLQCSTLRGLSAGNYKHHQTGRAAGSRVNLRDCLGCKLNSSWQETCSETGFHRCLCFSSLLAACSTKKCQGGGCRCDETLLHLLWFQPPVSSMTTPEED